VEGFTRRALVRQTWRLTFDWFPKCIELPISPVREVSRIQYVDVAGATQTLAESAYQVELVTDDRALIKPAYSEVWPSTQSDTFDAVTVEFIAGYAVPFSTNFGSDINQLDATANPFSNGGVVQLFNIDGDLPDPLAPYTNYYVVNSTADALELSTSSGGTPITLTTDGTGTHFAGLVPEELIAATLLLVGTWYENREAVVVGTTATELPLSVKSLLMPYTSIRF
jgi:hypothetical protein